MTFIRRFFIFIIAATLCNTLLASITGLPAKYHPGGDDYEAGDDAPYIPAIVKYSSEEELFSLLGEEGILLRRRGDMALAFISRSEMTEALAKAPRYIPGDKKNKNGKPGARIEFGRRLTPSLDKAKEWYGAGRVHSGEGLPQSFTGKGVVVGICDIGFDPSHPAFHDPITGDTRIKRLTQYKEAQGERYVMDKEAEYIDWSTDSAAYYHATHVAGILSGSDNSLGYGGIASGSDIVISTSQLSDVGLLAGVEDILEYAREAGKPAVVNLSMGCNTGPHDGTSLFSQYLDRLGEEAIICISAGNEGNPTHSNTVTLHFDGEHNRYGQRIHNYRWNQFDIYGMTDIWSRDNKPLRITPIVFDETLSEIVYKFDTLTLSEGEEWGVSTLENPSGFNQADEQFRKYFKGWLYIEGGINAENGKYNLALQYDLHTDIYSEAGAWARYNIGFLLEGEAGTTADVFTDGSYSRLRQIPGSPEPGSTFSISDLATGKNVISVGMYNNRQSYPLASGGNHGDYDAGKVNINSSYGTLPDGRVYPHTVAPGYQIVAAGSAPYIAANPEDSGTVCAISQEGDRTWYWQIEGGTSMSSPYVAGFMATWLEADPTLDITDISRIIAATNRKDMPEPENPRHGQGWFDPYEGLKYVLRNVSADMTAAGTPFFKGEMRDGIYKIFNPLEESLHITATDMRGIAFANKTTCNDTSLDLSQMRGEMVIIVITSADTGKRSVEKCIIK